MKESSFHIITSRELNAQDLTALVTENKKYWEDFFPLTVRKNSTLKSSLLFLIEIQLNEQTRELFLFGMRDTISKELCGLLYLKNIDWDIKEAEVAYAISQEYSGKGWTTQAVHTISKEAFEMGLETLRIICHKTNAASVGVALKSNYIWQKTLPNEFSHPKGDTLDMELYTLSKPNYD